MKVGDSVKGNNILELLVGIAVLSVVIYVAVHIAGMICGVGWCSHFGAHRFYCEIVQRLAKKKDSSKLSFSCYPMLQSIF